MAYFRSGNGLLLPIRQSMLAKTQTSHEEATYLRTHASCHVFRRAVDTYFECVLLPVFR